MLAAAAWAAGVERAAAIYLTEKGPVAHLQGGFEDGDEKIFEAFLKKPRAGKIKVLYLYSYGGTISSAAKIAEMVRKAGIATAVRAADDVCDSACTLVFAGGVRRYYIGGDSVMEGNSSRTGLGYHPARKIVNVAEGSHLSEGGSSRLSEIYAKMGCPGASDLMRRAAINTVFRPSGATALKLRIATSLADPGER
ncbi:MAG: hypothetical protein BGP06_14190 [Rhizobiales bacterium 65-9]|nr:MAG: hypothetical protein BGP06_14190 [Rhizobiales bacterium 65-9]